MTVVVVTPPPQIVGLALAKAHLRVDGSDDDVLIGAYLAAACSAIDGPFGWLGRALGVQVLEYRADDFGCSPTGAIPLPYGPVIGVVSVEHLDDDGADQTLVQDVDYVLVDGEVRPAFNKNWPSVRRFPDSVRIRYRAGYVQDPLADPLVAAIPPAITAAVLLITGDLYAFRETSVVGATAAEIPMSASASALLNPFRVWSF